MVIDRFTFLTPIIFIKIFKLVCIINSVRILLASSKLRPLLMPPAECVVFIMSRIQRAVLNWWNYFINLLGG